MPSIISLYLVRSFLRRFIYVLLSMSALIFIVNISEVIKTTKQSETISAIQIMLMSALKIPAFLADISIFVVMISVMLTLSNLSAKSEITVMRSIGLSIWRIISPIIIANFIIGLIFIFLFLPFTIYANRQYIKIENEFVHKKKEESFTTPITILEKKHKNIENELKEKDLEKNSSKNLEEKPTEENLVDSINSSKNLEENLISQNEEENFTPSNGIWLKQINLENKAEELKIRADKIYKNNLKLDGVTIWFFDKNHSFYKKIDAKEMYLMDNKWVLKSIILNDINNVNVEIEEITIPTNLKPEFILQKIIDNFQDPKSFAIIDLPKLIKNLESSGFSSRKFKVYFNILLNYPILFSAMSIIAAYFSINHIRNRNNIFHILGGVIFGLIAYVGLNIVNAIGSSGVLPIFMATWLMTFLFLAVSILLIFKKESL